MREPRPAAWFERAFGPSYPVVYAHRDEAEADRALDLVVQLLGMAPAPWLDLGCGQGRHLAALRSRGLEVLGLDLSADLLALARDRDGVGGLLRGDMRSLPLADDSIGAVLSLFTAFGYFGGARAHQPVVDEIARVLTPGGVWLLDFLDSERVVAELAGGPATRVRDSGPLRVAEQRVLLAGPRRVRKEVSLSPRSGQEDAARRLGVDQAGLMYHEEVTLFTLDELDGLAAGAGMQRVAAVGGYDGRHLRPGNSARWLLVFARKNGKDMA